MDRGRETDLMNTVKVTTSEQSLGIELPVLAGGNYLLSKSKEIGWFYSSDYIIPFFIDKHFIFKRLVFSTGILKKRLKVLTPERDFLNSIIDYLKKHRVCDFISKAQSNVVFNCCPKMSQCVEWGTYQVLLKNDKEALFDSFSQKSRNAIRRAIKANVIVEQTEEVSIVFNNIRATLERQKSIHYPTLDYLESLYKNVDGAMFFVATHNHDIQGSLVLLFDKECGYAMYAGSVKKPIGGSLDLLHFEVMQFLQRHNVKKYDFVGTRLNIQKGSKQEGIDRFKRKFNPILVEGIAFRTTIRPIKYFFYVIISRIYFKIRGIKYTDPIIEIEKCKL